MEGWAKRHSEGDNEPPTPQIYVWHPRIGVAYYLRIAIDKSLWTEADVHFVPNDRAGRPCLGPQCRLCPAPKRRHVFVAAEIAATSAPRSWRRVILDVSPAWVDILQCAGDGETVVLPARKRPNERVRWSMADKLDDLGTLQKWEGIDPLPILARMWGMDLPASGASTANCEGT